MSGSLVHVCFESQSPSSDYVNTQFHCCITTWKVLNETHHLQDHLKVASFLYFKKKKRRRNQVSTDWYFRFFQFHPGYILWKSQIIQYFECQWPKFIEILARQWTLFISWQGLMLICIITMHISSINLMAVQPKRIVFQSDATFLS